MRLIAAVTQDLGIGYNNDLLYRIPEDLKRFKELTMGSPVIMGRKTYESIGRTLPGRRNIVMTNYPKADTPDKLEQSSSIGHLKEMLTPAELESTFVIGGGQIYDLLMSLCTTAYITKIYDDKIIPENKFFPMDFSKSPGWLLAEASGLKPYELEDRTIWYQFLEYAMVTNEERQGMHLPVQADGPVGWDLIAKLKNKN